MAFTGDPVVAMDSSSDTQNTSGSTISTTYTATLTGGTACGFAFIAPPSGKVLFGNNVQMEDTTGFCFVTLRVRTGGSVGAGSDVVAASDDNSTWVPTNTNSRISTTLMVSGLTPGNTYNVQQLYRVSAGTGVLTRKHVWAQPQE